MFDSFEVRRALIIAPLRVARDVWPAEIAKWRHLSGLSYAVAVGNERERKAALLQQTRMIIINRENIPWLIEKSGLPFDFDMVVVDELSSFKSRDAQRFKALMKIRPRIQRIVGLTGTPAANGLMDLWAEFRLLDMGRRLGRYIGRFRDEFFTPDKRNGMVVFSYKPKPGAEDAIYKRISDITISMKSADFLNLPECVMNEIPVRLSAKEQAIIDDMLRDLIMTVKDETITAANAAVLSNKLMQMANGAIYADDGKAIRIHGRKLDELEDLLEAANGKSVLHASIGKSSTASRVCQVTRKVGNRFAALAATATTTTRG